MELKLAIVQTCDNTGCRVHLLDGKQQVDTVYAQPILTYNLVIRPTDLVAVDVANRPYRTVARWQRVTVSQVEDDTIWVDDGSTALRAINCPSERYMSIAIGDELLLWGDEIADRIEEDFPANLTVPFPDFIAATLVQIELMYEQLNATRPWPPTVLRLENRSDTELPPEFQQDDVRYPPQLVEHFLNEYTQEGDVVFDPFAGYGTTLLVAERMGRVGYGIEYDERKARYIQSQLQYPTHLIHGDSRNLAVYELPPIDFSMTSPPYMSKTDEEDPLASYTVPGEGYTSYLAGIQNIYRQLQDRLKPNARVLIEVANLKRAEGITPLAWDIAHAVGEVLYFEGEIVVDWGHYGYGYDHSYCLLFSKQPPKQSAVDSKALVAQSYDQIADAYLVWSQTTRVAERIRYTKLIRDSLVKGADLLELGCATATHTTTELARHCNYTGVDISPRQIEMAKAQLPHLTFICADMTELNFLPESFDGIVAFYSIVHVPRQEQPALLRKIALWLRPRGFFVASFTAGSLEGGYEEDWLGAPMYWSGYDPRTTIRMVEEAGLEIVSAQEETEEEFGEATTFLWVVARKPRW